MSHNLIELETEFSNATYRPDGPHGSELIEKEQLCIGGNLRSGSC
jgi:hypothetical protein